MGIHSHDFGIDEPQGSQHEQHWVMEYHHSHDLLLPQFHNITTFDHLNIYYSPNNNETSNKVPLVSYSLRFKISRVISSCTDIKVLKSMKTMTCLPFIIQREKYKGRDIGDINKEREEDKFGESIINEFLKLQKDTTY